MPTENLIVRGKKLHVQNKTNCVNDKQIFNSDIFKMRSIDPWISERLKNPMLNIFSVAHAMLNDSDIS